MCGYVFSSEKDMGGYVSVLGGVLKMQKGGKLLKVCRLFVLVVRLYLDSEFDKIPYRQEEKERIVAVRLYLDSEFDILPEHLKKQIEEVAVRLYLDSEFDKLESHEK